ncbi:MAG: hypothetical protein CFH08_01056 [Alphaproteobacteria bacterium MarineAlpha3_Bin7]|nr:MAG: hypothetical protein CFH08_01056 [Alphaproteobacteria bacterium MarineAlpha3_Bin7]|tara:strand:+ start:684 stop:1097 length:414 start_codon:yes stop_codon:yes gene_type:complete
MELGYSTIALLFPAIPLMFLVYSNTSTAVGGRLRELFEKIFNEKLNSEESKRITGEVEYLSKRLSLLRSAQMLVGLTFLFNILTMVGIYLGKQEFAQYLFGITVLAMMISILVYLSEILITIQAVKVVLNQVRTKNN